MKKPPKARVLLPFSKGKRIMVPLYRSLSILASVWNEVSKMKKRVTSLLLALVMALALLPAAAAEPTAPVQVSGLAQGQTGFLAGYDDMGRMVGLRVLTADGQVAPIPGATSMKLIRTDSGYAPQGQALTLSQNSGTVRKVDGQVRVCYGGPNGLTVSRPVTEKITGQITIANSSGTLYINGEWYSATELTVEGCALPISEKAFANWLFEGGSLFAVYDFYLDPSGSICWIDQREDGPYDLCVILSTQLSGDQLQAKILTTGGTVRTIPVAQGMLNEDAEGTFYLYNRLADGGYGLVRADESTPAEAGFPWGGSYVIPQGSPIQADADFTWGTIPCRADEQTRFLVAVGEKDKEYRAFTGVQFLPNTQAGGCVLTGTDGVAKYVFLDTPYFTISAPDGYVFLPSTGWQVDSSLSEAGVYLVDAVDTDGTSCWMRVTDMLRRAIGDDHMELGAYDANALVGRFCAITAVDQIGVVLGLEPVEALDVLGIGDSVISLADGVSYSYGSDTKFIYVDMMWVDDLDDPHNMIGVLEPSRDKWVLDESGIIYDPATFFDPLDVDHTGAYSDNVEEQNPYDATYISVRAAVIPEKDDPTLAHWVYVVRQLW